jgi:hypothetical protein
MVELIDFLRTGTKCDEALKVQAVPVLTVVLTFQARKNAEIPLKQFLTMCGGIP